MDIKQRPPKPKRQGKAFKQIAEGLNEVIETIKGARAGRPSEYSQEQADIICERIANGESLRAICRDNDMPAQSTVFKWLSKHDDFAEQYARAREAQADTLFDEILDIADDSSNDWLRLANDEGQGLKLRENSEAIRRSVLRVDARKWMAGKLRPKKYGDKITNELTGVDGAPLTPILNVTIAKS